MTCDRGQLCMPTSRRPGQDPQQASQTTEVQLQNSDPRTIRDVSVIVRCTKRKGFGCSKHKLCRNTKYATLKDSHRDIQASTFPDWEKLVALPTQPSLLWASMSLTALSLESSRDSHMTIPQKLKDHFQVPSEPSPRLESPLKGSPISQHP